MKKSALLSIVVAATTVAAANVAYAAVPTVDRVGKPAPTVCPAPTGTQAKILHFDKVVFQLNGGVTLVPVNPADANALNALPRQTDLDVKIIDNPRTVADLESKVLSFLGAQPNNGINRDALRISDVEYASVVCP